MHGGHNYLLSTNPRDVHIDREDLKPRNNEQGLRIEGRLVREGIPHFTGRT